MVQKLGSGLLDHLAPTDGQSFVWAELGKTGLFIDFSTVENLEIDPGQRDLHGFTAY
jgi:hypothetical protein